jgi:monoamine oxidase
METSVRVRIRDKFRRKKKTANRHQPSVSKDDLIMASETSPSNNTSQGKNQIVDVLIIGAGACGLQCAASLRGNPQKPSFLVLEARDRVGGRIYTSQERRKRAGNSFEKGDDVEFYRDHGASWVHGIEQNPILSLLKSKQAISPIFEGNPWTRPDTILHKCDNISVYMNQQLISNESPVIEKAICRHYDIQRLLAQYANKLYETGNGIESAHLSIQDIRERLIEQKEIMFSRNEDKEVEQLYPFYLFLIENWNGTSATELQISSVAEEGESNERETDECYIPEGDFPGAHCKVKSGMISVLQNLTSKVNENIHLNEKVVQIEALQDNSLIQVKTSSGLTVDAKCCICTIPLGCLKKHADTLFRPPLCATKQESIQTISAGSYKKVFLTFDKIFWPVKQPLIGLIRKICSPTDGIGKYLLIANLWAKDDIPCLEAVLCGNAGKWACHKTDEAIKRSVLKFMSDAIPFPNIEDCCVACHVTRWEEDDFTGGSYSSFVLGTLERHVDTLCTPEWDGRLLFAGEATESEHMGSVHAALISGERASNYAQDFIQQARGLPISLSS